MKDCFLSPEGDVYYGRTHQDIADYIVKTVYKIDIVNDDLDIDEFEKYRDSKRFLVENGWIEYINRYHVGWWIDPSKTPTQAQIDKIYELTGEIFEDVNLLWPYICEVIFLILKNRHGKHSVCLLNLDYTIHDFFQSFLDIAMDFTNLFFQFVLLCNQP